MTLVRDHGLGPVGQLGRFRSFTRRGTFDRGGDHRSVIGGHARLLTKHSHQPRSRVRKHARPLVVPDCCSRHSDHRSRIGSDVALPAALVGMAQQCLCYRRRQQSRITDPGNYPDPRSDRDTLSDEPSASRRLSHRVRLQRLSRLASTKDLQGSSVLCSMPTLDTLRRIP